MKEDVSHIPVLLEEVLESFKDLKLNIFFDATVGAGGHAKEILKQHPEIKIYIGVDQDKCALKKAEENLKNYGEKVRLVNDNFEHLDIILKKLEISRVDGFLFDLGVSSMQLDVEERGFSIKKIGPLDMRMDISKKLTAEEVVNTYSAKDLEKIFKDYGEEKRAKIIAKAIANRREKKRIATTRELSDVVEKVVRKKRKIHPATLVFQALRIYVNDELRVLKKALDKAIDRLNTNGRIAVISFHSLEDRIVKYFFKKESKKEHVNIYKTQKKRVVEKLKVLTKKPIKPSLEEIRKNPRARSAKMRVAEKK